MKRFLIIIKNPLFVIFILSFLATWPLFLPGYFSHHDDLHVMRIFEMRKCFQDLQIPCRWVPDMGYGNGFPLYNYYSAFPYYIGALASFVFGYIGAAKLLFFIPLIFGGFSMYFLARELYGKWPGLVAAVFYLFAPYRAVDAYVRGAIAESFALALAPLVFYFLTKLAKTSGKKDFLGFALSLGLFLTCHNIMTILFLPVILFWGAICFWGTSLKKLLLFILSLGLGGGISAFFILPAFFEKKLIQSEALTRFDLDFRAHFVTIKQMFFSRFWGYGASVPGTFDGLSFQIGWPHWWMVIIFMLLLSLVLFKSFKLPFLNRDVSLRILALSCLILTVFFVSIFMLHNKSAFVWEKIGILQYAQFPWRFLSLSIFATSLLGGGVAYLIKKNTFISIGLIILVTSLNAWYFHPKEYFFNLTDSQKLSGTLFEDQQKAALFDYLPKTAIESREKAPLQPIINTGVAKVQDFQNHSNYFNFVVDVEKPTRIEMPVYEFPNWQVYSNNKLISHDHKNLLGRISFNLEPGQYKIHGEFKNTLIRSLANMISLLSLGLFIYLSYAKKLFR